MNSIFLNSQYSPTTLLMMRWIDSSTVFSEGAVRRIKPDPDTMAMLEFSYLSALFDELYKLETLGLLRFTQPNESLAKFEELTLTQQGLRLLESLTESEDDQEAVERLSPTKELL